jgi:mono/diheme cytochrome c family protein
MATRATGLLLAAAAAVILAACGGGHSSRSASSPAATPATSPGGAAVAASGKAVVTEHCSVCHSLTGRDDPRLQGGDLLGFHASRTQVVQFVREMPVVHRPLTSAELQAVVDYVIAAERRAAAR